MLSQARFVMQPQPSDSISAPPASSVAAPESFSGNRKPSLSRVRRWAPFFVPAFLLGWITLIYPLGLDQGIYATAAMKMLDGGALYRDAWDMKSPGIFFMYAAVIAVGGCRVWPLHLASLFVYIATGMAMHRLMRWWGGRTLAWTTYIVFLIVVFAWSGPITEGQPDDWMLPFLLWGTYLLTSSWVVVDREARRRSLIAGVMMGWVLILRSTMLLAVGFLPLLWIPMALGARDAARRLDIPEALEAPPPRFWSRFGRLLGWYIVGGVSIGLVTLLYFALTGSLGDFYYSQFVWVRYYAQTYSGWKNPNYAELWRLATEAWMQNFDERPLVEYALPAGLVGALLLRFAWRERVPLWSLAVLVMAGLLSFSNYLIQLKFFNYHHWSFLPFLCMASGIGVTALIVQPVWRLWRVASDGKPALRRATRALAIGMVVFVVATFFDSHTSVRELRKRHEQAVEYLIHTSGWAGYLSRLRFIHIYKPQEDHQIVEYIREQTPPGETPKLYIWGFRPGIYFSLGSSGPSRFVYNLPLRAGWSPPEWLEHVEEEVKADPPDYILIAQGDVFYWVIGNHRTSSDCVPAWLQREIDEHFERVNELDHLSLMRIYRRVSPHDAALESE